MEVADWIEMMQTANSNEVAYGGLLITLISGYLVAAYLVGEKFNRAQVITINAVYVVSALSMIAGLGTNSHDHMLARHHA